MTWLFIGDSFTVGMATKLTALFLSFSQTTVIEAHVGWSTSSWLANDRVANLIQKHHPNFVVYALGTNDASGQVLFQQHVQQLLDIGSGALVFWIGPFGTDDTERGQWTKEVVGQNYIDGLSQCEDLPRQHDGLHLTETSFGVLADRIAAELLDRAFYLY